ncbi:Pro-cathepsin H [Lonchura striata]|uniref:Pro-cathepsin H n=1 Tax=Lonchura striata TaxID=40157 RepID=A0A218UEB3_9PASE|nr:Pro-cathepsin H [Lonchura striata domestica]
MGWPVLLSAAALLAAAAAWEPSAEEERLFKAWMLQNERRYGPEEYPRRLRTFLRNKRRIEEHNAGNRSFQMGLNQFSDLTFAEFKKLYLWSEPQNCSATKGNFLRSSGPYPDSIDWRKKGNFVTPVKNQGPCGSCWTFSTTGCLESAIAIATGKLLSLAEQQLVDCAQAFNNHGCSGGLPSQAFEYILYNKGLMGEDSYPYRAKLLSVPQNGTCRFQPEKAIAFVKDVINITQVRPRGCVSKLPELVIHPVSCLPGLDWSQHSQEMMRMVTLDPLLQYDEDGMVEAVGRHNPVSFAFEVTSDFMHYRKGVYSNPRCEHTPDKVNHAVLAVGYGQEDGTPYWIVKNSWGRLWGMQGYFLIERGKNMCGLAACASYPVPQV